MATSGGETLRPRRLPHRWATLPAESSTGSQVRHCTAYSVHRDRPRSLDADGASERLPYENGETLSGPAARYLPIDVRSIGFRTVAVELTPGLSFQIREALFQRRPSQWSRIWPTSVALSRWLLEQSPESLAPSAKELGCGVGLVGMTLAHMGLQVEGTDREPIALAFAAGNAARNGLTGYSVSHLDWGEPQGLPSGLLVASDVLYEREALGRLFELLLSSGLLLPGGQLILGGPNSRPELLQQLVAMLNAEGYQHRVATRSVEWEGRTEEIGIHILLSPEH